MIEEGTEVNKILLRREGELKDITWDDEDPVEIEILVNGTTTPEAFDLDEDAIIMIQGSEDELLDELVYDDEEYFFSEDIQICINEEDVGLEDLDDLDFEGDI